MANGTVLVGLNGCDVIVYVTDDGDLELSTNFPIPSKLGRMEVLHLKNYLEKILSENE